MKNGNALIVLALVLDVIGCALLIGISIANFANHVVLHRPH